jgi:hypothetical protein
MLGLMSMAAAAKQFNQPLVIPTGGWPAGNAIYVWYGKADGTYSAPVWVRLPLWLQ